MNSVYWFKCDAVTKLDQAGVPHTSLLLRGYSWSTAVPSQRRLVEWMICGPLYQRLYFAVPLPPDVPHKECPTLLESYVDQDTGLVFRIERMESPPKVVSVSSLRQSTAAAAASSGGGSSSSNSSVCSWVWYSISFIPISLTFNTTRAASLRTHVLRIVAEMRADIGCRENTAQPQLDLDQFGFPPVGSSQDSAQPWAPPDAHEILLRCVEATARVPGMYVYPTKQPSLGAMPSDGTASLKPYQHVFENARDAGHLLRTDFSNDQGGSSSETSALMLHDNVPAQRLPYAVIVMAETNKYEVASIRIRGFLSLKEEPAPRHWFENDEEGSGSGSLLDFGKAVALLVKHAPATQVVIVVFPNKSYGADIPSLVPDMSDRGGQRTLQQIYSLCTRGGGGGTTPTVSLPAHLKTALPFCTWCPCAGNQVVSNGASLASYTYESTLQTAQFMAQIAQTDISRCLMFLLWKPATTKFANAVLLKRFVREGYELFPWHSQVKRRIRSADVRTGGGTSVTHKGVFFAEPGVSSLVELDATSYYPSICAEHALCVTMEKSATDKQAQTAARLSDLQAATETDDQFAARVVAQVKARLTADGNMSESADAAAAATAMSIDSDTAGSPRRASPTAREFAFLVQSRRTLQQQHAHNKAGADALKLVANAIIGNLKKTYMRFCNAGVADTITFLGRRYVQFFRAVFLELFDAQLVASITDSIVLKTTKREWTSLAIEQLVSYLTVHVLCLRYIKFSVPKFYQAYCVFATNRVCSLALGAERVLVGNVSGGVVKTRSEDVGATERQRWLDFYTYALTRNREQMTKFLTETRRQDLVVHAVVNTHDAAFLLRGVFPDLLQHLSSDVLLQFASSTTADLMDCDTATDDAADNNASAGDVKRRAVATRESSAGFYASARGYSVSVASVRPWYTNPVALKEFFAPTPK